MNLISCPGLNAFLSQLSSGHDGLPESVNVPRLLLDVCPSSFFRRKIQRQRIKVKVEKKRRRSLDAQAVRASVFDNRASRKSVGAKSRPKALSNSAPSTPKKSVVNFESSVIAEHVPCGSFMKINTFDGHGMETPCCFGGFAESVLFHPNQVSNITFFSCVSRYSTFFFLSSEITDSDDRDDLLADVIAVQPSRIAVRITNGLLSFFCDFKLICHSRLYRSNSMLCEKLKNVCIRQVIHGESFTHLLKKHKKDHERFKKCNFLKYFPNGSYKMSGAIDAASHLTLKKNSIRQSILGKSISPLPNISNPRSKTRAEQADEEIRSYLQKRQFEISRGEQLRVVNSEKRFFGFVEPHGPVFHAQCPQQ